MSFLCKFLIGMGIWIMIVVVGFYLQERMEV